MIDAGPTIVEPTPAAQHTAAHGAASAWLIHPMAESLTRLNVLPSMWLHPSRIAELADGWTPPAGPVPMAVHRHWSARLLAQTDLAPVTSMDDPCLVFALAPQALLAQLAFTCGLALNAAHVRRAITRWEVTRLQEQLGDEAIAFARARLSRTLAGAPAPAEWDVTRAHALCERGGYAVLAQALRLAEPALQRRAALRLPVDAQAARAQLEATGLMPAAALAVAREFLDMLEPTWVSSFPAPH